jgi:hypothetical protein
MSSSPIPSYISRQHDYTASRDKDPFTRVAQINLDVRAITLHQLARKECSTTDMNDINVSQTEPQIVEAASQASLGNDHVQESIRRQVIQDVDLLLDRIKGKRRATRQLQAPLCNTDQVASFHGQENVEDPNSEPFLSLVSSSCSEMNDAVCADSHADMSDPAKLYCEGSSQLHSIENSSNTGFKAVESEGDTGQERISDGGNGQGGIGEIMSGTPGYIIKMDCEMAEHMGIVNGQTWVARMLDK